jgi:SNF2 family DNA or RNA helicase
VVPSAPVGVAQGVTFKLDVRQFSDQKRELLAWQAHEKKDLPLPHLRFWNYDLCRVHRNGWTEEVRAADGAVLEHTVYDRPKPGCRDCGIHFRQHQRVSILWLYLKKHGLLADTMGSGKTTSAGGLIALLLESGELGPKPSGKGRVVITPRSPALGQWARELQRMMPRLNIAIATGSRRKRAELYSQDWQVLLIGPEMLRNDLEMLLRIPLALYLTDDIDQLRNPENQTSYACDKMGQHADRYVIMSGTPLQKKLPELHAVLDGIGGLRAFGSLDTFTKNHVRYGFVDGAKKVQGYRNLDIVKQKMAPMVLRRTTADFKDVTLPTIVPDDVFLDLYPSQRRKYDELRKGVIQILKDEGPQTKHVTALSKLHYGGAICAGLAALGEPDGPGTSMKMDWVINKVSPDGDLGDEKVIIFANLKHSIRALQDRLRAAEIGFTTVWGDAPKREDRDASQERFWTDPNCRVLLGTRAIEQSLNLQVSRHLINMDMILNPARMEQLAGRIRRDGSAYQHVFVHNLLTVNTQEERYLPMLEREAALAGHIWDENSELFEALDPMALLRLISG